MKGIKKWACKVRPPGHSRLVFFFAAKKKARQLENKAGTKGAKAEEMCGK